ncbi:SRPBCC domain-containing protein [Sinomonas sp.]|uniref:SRPBCC domain-containing protein n=1 Tax=Sinomonas sp. TaxID=1914986 RepID=UPI002CC8D2CA|nr:SRPBCC domain-containing protein [Sinomonas sp.]
MDPLFSHASHSPASSDSAETPPSRVYRMRVPAPQDIAYSAFVGDIHLWWGFNYTGFGEGTHVYVEDGVIGEESESGETQIWGHVVAEDAPSSIEFSWTLAWREDAPTRVRVEFAPVEDQATEVTFTHNGWASGSEGQAQYQKYSEWPIILARYAAFFGRSADAVETLA